MAVSVFTYYNENKRMISRVSMLRDQIQSGRNDRLVL